MLSNWIGFTCKCVFTPDRQTIERKLQNAIVHTLSSQVDMPWLKKRKCSDVCFNLVCNSKMSKYSYKKGKVILQALHKLNDLLQIESQNSKSPIHDQATYLLHHHVLNTLSETQIILFSLVDQGPELWENKQKRVMCSFCKSQWLTNISLLFNT